jgi:hypothetical protein
MSNIIDNIIFLCRFSMSQEFQMLHLGLDFVSGTGEACQQLHTVVDVAFW